MSHSVLDLIYELKADEFERLVIALLQADGYHVSGNVALPPEVDVVATKENKVYAVLIKHRRTLSLQDVGDFFGGRSLLQINVPRELLFVTSAQLTQDQLRRLQITNLGYKIQIIARDELLHLISSHADVAGSFLKPARHKRFLEKAKLTTSLVSALIAVMASILSNSVFHKPAQPLDERIKNVESALERIKGLEDSLSKVRDDMVATENATREINEKYTKAKELEKLTDAQLQLLRETLQAQTWKKFIQTFLLGLVTGIASKIIIEIIFTRMKQWKFLRSKLGQNDGADSAST